MHNLLINQNDDNLLRLLKASTVAYTKTKTWEVFNAYFHIFLAIAYPISYVIIKQEPLKLALFGCSFFLALLIQIVTGMMKGNTSKGAIFKEEFDTKLFNLPWKSTLKRPDHTEVSRLSLQYKGKEMKDWYSPNLSEKIPNNIAIAVLQHSNTSWDKQLRKLFRNRLIGLLFLYSILLITFVEIMNVDWLTKFFIAFSILSSYTYFIALIRGHSSIIEKRKTISKHLDEIISGKLNISIENLRDIQDEIYITRQESAKVPNFFFRLYKKRLNAIDEDYIESVNRTYNL